MLFLVEQIQDVPEVTEQGFNPFYDCEGNVFEFLVEVDSDDVRITDSIGRVMPIPHESINKFFKVFKALKSASKAITSAAEAQEVIAEDCEYIVA